MDNSKKPNSHWKAIAEEKDKREEESRKRRGLKSHEEINASQPEENFRPTGPGPIRG